MKFFADQSFPSGWKGLSLVIRCRFGYDKKKKKKSEQKMNGVERELVFNPDQQISVESHSSLEVHLTQGGSLSTQFGLFDLCLSI